MEQQAWKKELDHQAKAKAQAKGKGKPKAKAKAKAKSKGKKNAGTRAKASKEPKAKARGRPKKSETQVQKTPEGSHEADVAASPKAKAQVEKKAKGKEQVKEKAKDTAVKKRKNDGDKATFAGRYKSSTKTTGMIWECLRNKFESSLKSKLRSPSKLEARKSRVSKKGFSVGVSSVFLCETMCPTSIPETAFWTFAMNKWQSENLDLDQLGEDGIAAAADSAGDAFLLDPKVVEKLK